VNDKVKTSKQAAAKGGTAGGKRTRFASVAFVILLSPSLPASDSNNLGLFVDLSELGVSIRFPLFLVRGGPFAARADAARKEKRGEAY